MSRSVEATDNDSPPPGRTALVLAGGGTAGAVYEIGALRAIDDLLVNRTVNDFDIFVGTSAGALVASFLANGMSSVDPVSYTHLDVYKRQIKWCLSKKMLKPSSLRKPVHPW